MRFGDTVKGGSINCGSLANTAGWASIPTPSFGAVRPSGRRVRRSPTGYTVRSPFG